MEVIDKKLQDVVKAQTLEITDKELEEIFQPFLSNIKLRKPEVLKEFDLRYLLKHLLNNIDPAINHSSMLKTVMNNLLIFHTSNYLLNYCHSGMSQEYSLDYDITYQLVCRLNKSGNYTVALK